jgi:hypothetical protein
VSLRIPGRNREKLREESTKKAVNMKTITTTHETNFVECKGDGMGTRASREKIENQLLAIDFDIAVLTETNTQFNSILFNFFLLIPNSPPSFDHHPQNWIPEFV